MFTLKQNLKETDQPTQLRGTCHSVPSPSAKQDALRIRTSHVSFRLHAILGTTCPGLFGSSRLPLPPPSLVGRGQLCRRIHGCADSKIRQRHSLSWVLDRTCVKLRISVKKQIPCTSLLNERHSTKFARRCCTKERQSCSVSLKETTQLRLFLKVRTTSACLPLPLPFLVVLAFLCAAVVAGGSVVCSSTWSPAIFQLMSQSTTVNCTC